MGSFTGGRPLAPHVAARDVDLFLSDDPDDVAAAIAGGAAAARFADAPPRPPAIDGELRVALDGDAVLFGDEADRIHREHGLDAFLRHEVEQAGTPMARGPFAELLRILARLRLILRRRCDGSAIRLALVTARTAPAHARALRTLRAWGVEVDEAHFVGGGGKAEVLLAYGAHVFFDDMERHVAEASRVTDAALVLRRCRTTPSVFPTEHVSTPIEPRNVHGTGR